MLEIIMGLRGSATLLVLLLTASEFKRSVTSKSYSAFDNARNVTCQNSSTVHNVTADCGDPGVLTNTVWQCQRDLNYLTRYGFPWLARRNNSRNNPNATDRSHTLRDALDSLNHVCRIHDRSRACLEERGIGGYCLRNTILSPSLQEDFYFICHLERDENLVHSLQCLHDTRLFAMLLFQIASRCRGFAIADDLIRRYKKAYFYTLNINPHWDKPTPSLLYCLPKSVISICIKNIVEDHCGTVTANFVQNYFVYIQDRLAKDLQSAGLNSDICDYDVNSDMEPNKPPIPSDYTTLAIPRLLENTAPGTALDTVWGKYTMAYLHTLSGEELCIPHNAGAAYSACVMSSDNKAERSKFNILQFAHQLLLLSYHGSHCSRLEQFTACWNLLQEICGSKVRGMEQHATLLVEGCKIQSEMLDVGCPWQDILLPHYIQASRVTVWPTSGQCLYNPMYLEDSQYGTMNSLMHELDTVLSLLQPGVEEISRKCGSKFGKRITLVLNKLSYFQRDATMYMDLLVKYLTPN